MLNSGYLTFSLSLFFPFSFKSTIALRQIIFLLEKPPYRSFCFRSCPSSIHLGSRQIFEKCQIQVWPPTPSVTSSFACRMKSQILMTHKVHTTRPFLLLQCHLGHFLPGLIYSPIPPTHTTASFRSLKGLSIFLPQGLCTELFPLLPDTWLTPPHPQGIRVSVSSPGRPSLNQQTRSKSPG